MSLPSIKDICSVYIKRLKYLSHFKNYNKILLEGLNFIVLNIINTSY